MTRNGFDLRLQYFDCERLASLDEGAALVIGRAPGADVFFAHASISRRHIRLEARHDEVVMIDLASRNGTRVGGLPARRLRLGRQTLLQLGKLPFSLTLTPRRDGRRSPEAIDWSPAALACRTPEGSGPDQKLEARLAELGFKDLQRLGHGPPALTATAPDGTTVRVRAAVLDGLDQDLARRDFMAHGRRLAILRTSTILERHEVPDAEGLLLACWDITGRTSLRRRLAEGPLAFGAAVHIARRLLEALVRIHKHQLRHGAISVDTVFLDVEGHPGLSDLGAGVELDLQAGGRELRPELGVTIAPEAFTHAMDLDDRSDLFAIGALLVAMLTGRPPWPGATAAGLARAALLGVPIGPRLDELPPALQPVVARLLAIDPAERFPDAGSAAIALERAALDHLMPGVDAAVTPEPDRESGRRGTSFGFLAPQLLEVLLLCEALEWSGDMDIHVPGDDSTRLALRRGRIIAAGADSGRGLEVILGLMMVSNGELVLRACADDQEAPAGLPPFAVEDGSMRRLMNQTGAGPAAGL